MLIKRIEFRCPNGHVTGQPYTVDKAWPIEKELLTCSTCFATTPFSELEILSQEELEL